MQNEHLLLSFDKDNNDTASVISDIPSHTLNSNITINNNHIEIYENYPYCPKTLSFTTSSLVSVQECTTVAPILNIEIHLKATKHGSNEMIKRKL